ncbi:MAG TPA: molybdopterin-dependent oxidoreductase [Planktothrix sp.]|jgi:DMSO/TMAO reductase YedYZ molybdopterin-dependent catalytic subunit/thiosulfate reductase cytochrome b subunit
MHLDVLGFPLWLRITHFCNFLFLTLLIRSGIQILSDHPKLYWNDHCYPGSEWLKFGKRDLPTRALWTSMDEAVDVSPVIALPGQRHALGAGRHWHFLPMVFWLINGFIYITLLFCTGNWRRLVPTSSTIIPRALHDMATYMTLHKPPLSEFQPYDALQQLVYFSVVFVLTPLTILSGIAMSPALEARFPWYANVFRGQQKARSLHFLCMVSYVLFLIVHVTMVFVVHFKNSAMNITLGGDEGGSFPVALALFFGGILLVIALNWLATAFTRKNPRAVQNLSIALIEPIKRLLFRRLDNVQEYTESEISPYFRVNGRPPETEEYLDMMQKNFLNYKLRIFGLVENPVELSLEDLRELPRQSYTTKHVCIQGWTAIGQWAGVELSEILKLCNPLPNAKRIYFHSFQLDPHGRAYYTSLDLDECEKERTILAYEMNHQSLPMEHGAPLRLRCETKLGFKMCKWIRSIEVVASIKDVGLGQGGYREDYQYYGTESTI